MNSYNAYPDHYYNNTVDNTNTTTNTNANTNNTNTNDVFVRLSYLESDNERLRQALIHEQVSCNDL